MSYTRLTKDEQYAIIDSRLVEASIALAIAEIDEEKLKRVADGSDAYGDAMRETKHRIAQAKRRIAVSTKEADKLKKPSKAEKSQRTKAIKARVTQAIEELIKNMEAHCFQSELNLAELDNAGARETEEAQLRIYREGIAVAAARLE